MCNKPRENSNELTTGTALETVETGGRPAIALTDQQKDRLVGMAALGLSQELAASRLGFSGRTLRRIFKRDEDASLKWALGRAEAAEKALRLLWGQAEAGQPAASIFLGKCLAGLREKGGEWGDDAALVAVQIVLPGPAENMQQWSARHRAVEVDAEAVE